MVEAKKSAKQDPPKQDPPKLGRAGESGDAGVQNLLAQRSIHTSNGDDERTAEIDRQLAELGLTAQ